MSPHTSRRALLGAVGAAVVSAGCSIGGSSGGDGSTTYGFEVNNELDPSLFEHSEDVSQRPARVDIVVRDVDPQSDEVYFERTVEVETGESTTISDAFTAEKNGPTYAVDGSLESFTDEGIARQEDRQAGFSFKPGEFGTPSDPIRFFVENGSDMPFLYPVLTVQQDSGEQG